MTANNLELYFVIEKLREFGMKDHEIAHTLVVSMERFKDLVREYDKEYQRRDYE